MKVLLELSVASLTADLGVTSLIPGPVPYFYGD